MSDFFSLNLLVLLGSLLALIGGLICLGIKPLARLLSHHASSFAAGVLLTVTILGLLPEAVHELGETAFTWLLGAFIVTYLFENFIFELHHHAEEQHAHHTSAIPLVIFGDTIHNFIDGAAIAAAYLATPALGITTALSTFLHEVPHEMSDFGVLLQAGWRRKKIIWANVLSALTSFLGAWLVWFIAEELAIVGYLLAISAGIFLYLAASDFLPKPKKGISYKKSVLIMLLGILIMVTITKLVPHGD
ncbi:MAG TPA: ZIP family metal transporter [Patescibacteria group bacterium]